MQLALMIEGQNGLDWPRWQRIAREAEELGFYGLYRSDHYTNPNPPEKDSLELWISLTWLADHSSRLHFGPIVSPVTFRHPALSARMAMQVDALSGGRLSLGLGAGWQEREHHMFGLPLLDMKQRFDRFDEALEVAARLMRDDAPLTFEGEYYQLRDAVLLPHAERAVRGGNATPILVGGNGEKRTLPAVARWADEWNAVMITASKFAALNTQLDGLLDAAGRPRNAVRRSMMHGITYGTSAAHLEQALQWRSTHWSSRTRAEDMRARGEIVGVGDEVIEQIAAYEAVGLDCLMLQWLDVDDIDALRHFARTASRWLRPNASE